MGKLFVGISKVSTLYIEKFEASVKENDLCNLNLA